MKKTIITLALVALAGQTWGRTLTPAEALDRALGDAATPARVNAMRGIAAKTVTPALTITDKAAGNPSLYVITPSDGKGYLIVSADDVAIPLLGYSDNGTFDPDNMPDNLRWWLEQYGEAISVAARDGVETSAPAYAPARKAIAPLVKAHWDQDAPYNNDCPRLNGEPTMTGCVATAMAQILYYHKWPEKGIGTYSYEWTAGKRTLSFDYGNTSFKWARMTDSYKASATEEQKAAVAELMYACGVSVDMNYGTSASGAVSTQVAPALREYFNYDNGVRSESRYNYTTAEWEELVYNEISTNGPVYYSGQSPEGGHAFVCDGYADGFFHFNWGWSGMSDGYFLLNALDPASQGIGGYSSGFNQRQAIIAGIRKPQPDSELPAPNITLMTPITIYPSGQDLTITGPFYSYTPYYMPKSVFQIVMVNDKTGEEIVRRFMYNVNMGVSGYYPNFTVTLPSSKIPEGTYTATIGVKYNDVFYPVRPVVGDTGKLKIVVTSSGFEATVLRSGSIKFGSTEVLSPFYQGKVFGLKANYEYESETPLYTQIVPFLTDAEGRRVANGSILEVELAPGKGSVEYSGEFTKNVPTGDYFIALYRCVGTNKGGTSSEFEPLSTPVAVTVSTLSWTRDPIVSCSEWEIKDAENVDPSNLVITATPQVTMGYYASPLMACVFSRDETQLRPQNAIATFYSPTLFIDQGEKCQTTITADFVGAEPGKTYQLKIFSPSGTSITQNPKTFTVSEGSAITDIEADNSNAPVEYFNLQGQRVLNPASGLYIRRQGDKAEKVYVE